MFSKLGIRKNFRFENLYIVLLCSFAFFLPISEKISTLLIIASLLVAFLGLRNQGRGNLKNCVFLILLYAIYIVAYARDGVGFGLHWFETKASFLIFPLLFYLSPLDRPGLIKVLKAFVLGCVISYFVCLLHPFIFNFDWSAMEFIPLRTDKVSLPVQNENYGWLNYFVSIGFNNTIDRAYLACYSVFSLVFLVIFHKKFERQTLLGLIFLLIVALIQIGSMSGILSLSTIPFLIFLYFGQAKIKLISVGFYLLVFFAFYTVTDRFQGYYTEVTTALEEGNSDYDTILNDRMAFWKSAIEVFRENPVFGHGVGTAQEMMNQEQQKVLEWSDQWVNYSNFNAHNLYLQLMIETGIVGIALFLLAVVWFLYRLNDYPRDLKFLGYSFMVLFCVHSISESMFNRYVGIAFFTFFYSLILTLNNQGPTIEKEVL